MLLTPAFKRFGKLLPLCGNASLPLSRLVFATPNITFFLFAMIVKPLVIASTFSSYNSTLLNANHKKEILSTEGRKATRS